MNRVAATTTTPIPKSTNCHRKQNQVFSPSSSVVARERCTSSPSRSAVSLYRTVAAICAVSLKSRSRVQAHRSAKKPDSINETIPQSKMCFRPSLNPGAFSNAKPIDGTVITSTALFTKPNCLIAISRHLINAELISGAYSRFLSRPGDAGELLLLCLRHFLPCLKHFESRLASPHRHVKLSGIHAQPSQWQSLGLAFKPVSKGTMACCWLSSIQRGG